MVREAEDHLLEPQSMPMAVEVASETPVEASDYNIEAINTTTMMGMEGPSNMGQEASSSCCKGSSTNTLLFSTVTEEAIEVPNPPMLNSVATEAYPSLFLAHRINQCSTWK